MREIKFRAKTANNRWAYGSVVGPIGEHSYCYIVEENDKKPLVKTDTIGQYTGLIDQNGKDIYEGDIVKMNTIMGGTYIVSYEDSHIGAFSLISPRTKQFVGIFGRDYDFEPFYCEVIGNIYDNKELLQLTEY